MNLFDFKYIGNNKNSVLVHYFYYYFKEAVSYTHLDVYKRQIER